VTRRQPEQPKLAQTFGHDTDTTDSQISNSVEPNLTHPMTYNLFSFINRTNRSTCWDCRDFRSECNFSRPLDFRPSVIANCQLARLCSHTFFPAFSTNSHQDLRLPAALLFTHRERRQQSHHFTRFLRHKALESLTFTWRNALTSNTSVSLLLRWMSSMSRHARLESAVQV
jgi:hypothetical protein